MSMPTTPNNNPLNPGSGRALGRRFRILVVDSDARAAGAVADILRAENWDVAWAHSGAAALERVRMESPDAIIADIKLADMDGPSLFRALRARSETATVPIMALSASGQVADRVAALRAGASDLLVKPPDPAELVARLQAALDLLGGRAGLVVAVTGARAGMGASLVAANLTIALHRETRAAVALADLAQAPSLDMLLNLQARLGVADLLDRADELEAGDLESILTAHASGIEVLLPGAEDDSALQIEQARKALLALRRAREFVVADVSPWPREMLAATLELADRLLLVLVPEITALRDAARLVRQVLELGMPRERMLLILNRSPVRGGLRRQDVEGAVGLPVRFELANDTPLVTYSTNRGVPLALSHPRSRLGRQFSALAKAVAQPAGPV